MPVDLLREEESDRIDKLQKQAEVVEGTSWAALLPCATDVDDEGPIGAQDPPDLQSERKEPLDVLGLRFVAVLLLELQGVRR